MGALAERAVGTEGGGVVQVEQHGRMAHDRQHHVAEAAGDMRADRFLDEGGRDRGALRRRFSEMTKWLVQNQTSRSRNGAGVVTAFASWAAACALNSARLRDSPGGGFVARSSRNAARPSAVVGGSSNRVGSGWRS